MEMKKLFQMLAILLIAFSTKAQLTGEWSDNNGSCYKIRQIGNQIFWYMDGSPRVMNVFVGYIAGNTITGEWADLPGGSMQGNGTLALRIESGNRMIKIDQTGSYGGSVWTRGPCSRTPQARSDLSGIWYDYSNSTGNAGLESRIWQQGDQLRFTNSFNSTAEGYFIDNSNVIATGWEGGLRAKLEDNGRRIMWQNGSIWQRSKR
jgi:hypothetical protein